MPNSNFLRHPPRNGTHLAGEPPLRSALLASMLGPGMAIAIAAPRLVDDQLFPEERRYIARAVEKRRAEFGTARMCARHALAELGVPGCSLVPHSDRSPFWPQGVVGSVSHTAGCCVVAVTKEKNIIGVGIDIEPDEPLRPELIPLICTAAELRSIGEIGASTAAWLGKLFFCAKEAFYKCQYNVTKTVMDFHDVELAIDTGMGTFAISQIANVGPEWDLVSRASGKFRRESGFVVATTVLESNG